MDNIATYGQTELPQHHATVGGGTEWVEMLIEAGMVTHDDVLPFLFAPLDEIRKHMEEAGYSAEEIEADIAGLSELPEYANSHGSPKR